MDVDAAGRLPSVNDVNDDETAVAMHADCDGAADGVVKDHIQRISTIIFIPLIMLL